MLDQKIMETDVNGAKRAPVTLLIVDDDEVCREILQDAIHKEEVKVVVASDGIEAMEKLGAEPIDILISDLNMPRMDGLTLLKLARQQYPHILSIIITGYGSLQSAIEAIRLGAYDYVQKPFKIEEIMVAARNAIEKVRILREKTLLLRELEVLHQKLRYFETANGNQEDWDTTNSLEGVSENHHHLFSRFNLPLHFFELPSESPSRVLASLENLKELKRDGTINETEFQRLKRIIIERIESGKP